MPRTPALDVLETCHLVFRLTRILAVSLLFTVSVQLVHAQNPPNPNAGILMGSTNEFGIDLATSAINVSIPLRSKVGAIPFWSRLFGTSQAYQADNAQGGSEAFYTNTGIGPYSDPTSVSLYSTSSSGTCPQQPTETYSEFTLVSITDQTGASHSLGNKVWKISQYCPSTPGPIVTGDGSGYTFVITSHTSTSGAFSIYDASGNHWDGTCTSGCQMSLNMTDPDGNTISGGSSVTDTLGTTTLSVTYPIGNPNPSSFSYTNENLNPATQYYTLNYDTTDHIKTNFGCPNVLDGDFGGGFFLNSITTPEGSYSFAYEPTPNGNGFTNTNPPTYFTGRIAKITYPSGGSISYSYAGGNNGYSCGGGVVPTLTVTVNDNNGNVNTWTYVNNGGVGNYTVTKTDPAGSQTVYSFSGEYQTDAAYYQGPATGTPRKTVLICYNGNTSNCAAPTSNIALPITETDVRTTLDSSTASRVTTTFDTYGNPLVVSSYDFGGTITAPTGTLLSSTTKVYGQSYKSSTACNAYPSGTYINSTPCYIYTTNSAATTVAQTQIAYSTTGHPTSIKRWTSGSNWLTSSTTYNSNGTVAATTDPNNSVTTVGNYQCNGMLPGKATLPQISGESFQMSSSLTWDCNGGVLVSTTDLNTPANTTTYSYDDPLWRQTQISYPDGGGTTTTYNTGSSYPWTISTSTVINSTSNLTNTTTYDGLNREVNTALTSDPLGSTYSATAYNAIGEVYQVYNPTRCNPPTTNCGSATWGVTTYAYDALGRVTSVTNPDSSSRTNVYYERATKSTDEGTGNGSTQVQRIFQVDGLGRTTSVCEVTSQTQSGITPTPTACQQDLGATGFLTSYSYDALGNLLAVSQGGLNGRSYSYDGLSRLTQETNPETGYSSGNTATAGTINYVYSAGGDLYQRVAPEPNQTGSATATTTYSYDALHRLTDKSYSHSDGSQASPQIYIAYDLSQSWGGVSISNPKGHPVQFDGFNTGGNVSAGFVNSYDSMGRVTNQWQCTPLNCGTGAIYFTYGYDQLGELLTATNNADDITYTNTYDTATNLLKVQSSLADSQHPGTLVTLGDYSAVHAPLLLTLGNGLAEGLAYTNRGWNNLGQLYNSSQTTLYSYTLGFGPDGDVTSVNDSLNGNWTYSNGALNRLMSGACSGNCPATTSVAYGYDRFGNRWTEAITGTGFHPSYSFNANNQIIGLSYDAAGNITNDGVNSYAYDDENRIVSVTGVSNSASYFYGPGGNRVRSIVNGQNYDFFYDLSGRTVTQLTNNAWTRSEAYAGGLHIGTYANGTTYFDTADWLGTSRVHTNMSGSIISSCTSLPFGEDLTCSGIDPSPIQYTGQEHDSESGDDHFPFRYYNATMARWLSPDPAGLGAVNPANPQSWNRYVYVANNPLGATDPLGLQSPSCFINPITGTCFRGYTNGADPIVGACMASIDGGGDEPCSAMAGLVGSGDAGVVCTFDIVTCSNVIAAVNGPATVTTWTWQVTNADSTVIDIGTGQPVSTNYGQNQGAFVLMTQILSVDMGTTANNPMNWVIEDYSLLRLKQNRWKWAIGYGLKTAAVKLLKPAASTVSALTGVSALMMLASTMLDAGDRIMLTPPPPVDPCSMGLYSWVPDPNGTYVWRRACQ